jgi:hypothetical protein
MMAEPLSAPDARQKPPRTAHSMPKRISVVVSQGQSNHPLKRAVEEGIVGGLLGTPGIDIAVVTHLYDLAPESPGMLNLTGISGDIVICSWLYPRAAHWTLDRNGIRGTIGATLIPAYGEDEDDSTDEETASDDVPRVSDSRPLPPRTIYCLDLRTHDAAEPYIEEIKRIARESATQTVELEISVNGTPVADHRAAGSTIDAGRVIAAEPQPANPVADSAEGQPARRWYPVIDYTRCTNCLECIDFCLFGVYGIDGAETILVEQPDNCRKGCPACSRVCPENAIIFPQHKTPTIAGSPEVGGPAKIDLSALFGAPDPGAPGAEKALDVAVRERDEQLLLVGREVVGEAVGVSQASTKPSPADAPREPSERDELDALIDQLDALDW